jgi:DNA primase
MQLSELKDYIKSLSISSIIQNFVPLTKKGANYESLCPFHNDSNPSLKISDSKGLFKCFVCGEAGDAISFVQRFQDTSFTDSLRKIAEILGIEVEEKSNYTQNPKFALAIRILQSLEKLFHNSKNSKEFQEFQKVRKLTNETIEIFRLGFANNNNIATQYLLKQQEKLPDEKIIEIGLEIGVLKRSNQGQLYDNFRNRIMFPIWDQTGNIRGFGSRSIKDSQIPKYLNSKESFVFNKKFLLYGLNIAKKNLGSSELKDEGIILTEGYMDTIAFHQVGIKSAVAVMGIALSENKALSLANLTSNITLAFDNDKAGIDAAKRINQTLMDQKVLAKKLDLAPEKDPDEFLKNQGLLEMKKRLENALVLLDIEIDAISSQSFGDNTDLKLKALQEVYSLISPLGESLSATERLLKASESLELKSTTESLQRSYQNWLKSKKHSNSPIVETPRTDNGDNKQNQYSQRVNFPKAKPITPNSNTLNKIEKWIIGSALDYPSICASSKFTEIIEFAITKDSVKFLQGLQKINLEAITNVAELTQRVTNLISDESYNKPLKDFVYSSLFEIKQLENDKEQVNKMINDLQKKIAIQKLKEDKQMLMQARMELLGKEKIAELDQKVLEMSKKISDLKLNHK